MWGTIAVVVGTVITMGLAVVLAVYAFQGVLGGFVDNELALSILLLMIVLAPLQALDSLLISLFATFGSARSIFFRRYVFAPVLQLGIVGRADRDGTAACGRWRSATSWRPRSASLSIPSCCCGCSSKQGLIAELRRETRSGSRRARSSRSASRCSRRTS